MKISILSYLTAALFLFTCTNICAQPTPAVEWQKCLGSIYGDFVQSIQPTSDGGYIAAGFTWRQENNTGVYHDILVVKIDRTGNIEWERYLGRNYSDGASIIQTDDGGYMLAGSVMSTDCNMTGYGGYDFWLVKLNSNGGIIWQKIYGGSRTDHAYSIALSLDGGYFVSGLTRSENGDVTGHHGNVDAWVIKVDAAGNLIWQKTLGGTRFEEANSVKATPDGGCIVGGFTGSDNGDVTGFHGTIENTSDLWVVKLDNSGAIQWQKALGGSMSEIGGYVQLTNDGGYIVAGQSNSSDGDLSGNRNSFDAWIVKLTGTGNIEWEKTYGGSGNESVSYIENTPDGGYVFTGGSNSADGDIIICNVFLDDLMVMKINDSGDLEWEKSVGSSKSEQGLFVKALIDGSFIIAGYTDSPDIAGFHNPPTIRSDDSDGWIIKLSAPLATVPAPVVKIDPASAIICAGNKATLTASVLYGGISPVYQWTKNGIPVGTNSPQYTDLNLADNDQVICTVKPGNICENTTLQGSDTVSIKVKTNTLNPVITIVADNTYSCNCTDITIKATVSNAGGAPAYQWKINGNDTGSNSPVFVSNQLKDGDIITCLYTDNTTCGVTGSIISNSIRISNGNGAVPFVSIAATADTICKGVAVTLTANTLNAGINPAYQWKVNNINTGTNNPVFISSALSEGDIVSCFIKTDPLFACAADTTVNSNDIVMHVFNQVVPSVSIAASADTICAGSAVSFTATASNAGTDPSYQWKINGANTGTNEKSFSSSSLANGDIINCTIMIDPLHTCALTNQAVSQNITMKVNIGAYPSVDITASQNDICAGENILFTAVAHDAGVNPVFQWIVNNTILPDQSAVYSSSSLKNGDRLFCRVIPGTGACSAIPDSSNIVVAIIKDTPVVYLSPADTIIAPGMQVQINAVVPGTVASFQWSPADKLINSLSLSAQTTLLNETTNYKLMVTDDKGCSATATAVIKISTGLYMPNAFTPDNDGINDLFRIPATTTLTLKEFSVYNRWGNKLFSTSNAKSGWDGIFNGKKQNAGVYIYFIKSVINNKEVFLKGSFILVR